MKTSPNGQSKIALMVEDYWLKVSIAWISEKPQFGRFAASGGYARTILPGSWLEQHNHTCVAFPIFQLNKCRFGSRHLLPL